MKTWFITGISRGLGKALAEAALARGDTVIGTVREGRPEIATGNGLLHVQRLDLTDTKAIESAVGDAFATAGRVDVVVNNAGYGLLGALEEAKDAEFERLFAVNVFAPFAIIRAALPELRRQGSGHIINLTSIAGRAPTGSSGLYAATKSALEGMTQSLAQEIAPFGLKATAVAPGAFRTDFLSDHSIRRSQGAGNYAESVGKSVAILDAMAGRQIGDPDRAAAAILALADSAHPPVHLLLGTDALRRAREKLGTVIEEIDRWEDLTRSTDFAAEE
ncbi:SDR family NAD(P)-dependent oxidoreductase [Sphingomonas gei]|uniref:SDR family NAD(P)-dependent oxidoreductase n=1 Tax=Sphingomonas gei TaxID=1395960 RepID=A0A4V3QZA8_9SPHN|nr:oxidoreductase [Sphingomonas gei]TGX53532.1 SDR family NAD(P)-dependent oxidoreductase [Sphingomonas gei]